MVETAFASHPSTPPIHRANSICLKRGVTVAKAMTKTEVIKELATRVKVDRKTAIAFMEQVVALAVRETKKSGQFQIPGLGKAVKAARKARMGRNPATGETIKIAAKTVVKFRLAKAFKDAIVPPKAKKK
jgi:DNA-binding protein HU-beta